MEVTLVLTLIAILKLSVEDGPGPCRYCLLVQVIGGLISDFSDFFAGEASPSALGPVLGLSERRAKALMKK
jgi:hypothetical protein